MAQIVINASAKKYLPVLKKDVLRLKSNSLLGEKFMNWEVKGEE